MKVSVIIPTYNVEQYITKCLDSVVMQTESNIEIIVIDDVSSDNTVKIVKEYTSNDNRIKLFVNQTNSGPSKTRNKGISEAKGEYIAFLDSDDWWSEDRVECLLQAANAFDADMVCDDQFLIDDRKTDPWGTVFHNGQMSVTEPTFFSAVDFITKNMGLKPMIKREFMNKYNICFNEALRYGEDYLLFLQCLMHGAKALLLPDAYYYYRAREGSLVTNNMKLLEQTLGTTEELLEDPFYKKNPEVTQALKNRRKNILEAIKYYRFMQPIKNKDIGGGLVQMVKSPDVLFLLLKRAPRIINNRIFRKIIKNR